MADRLLIREVPVGVDGAVMENQKKRLARNEKLLEENQKLMAEKKKEWKAIISQLKIRTHKYEREYEAKKRELINLRRQAREIGGFYKEPETKVIFIIRLKGVNKLAPKPKKILQLFRLRQIHNGVFLRLNKAVTEMIRFVEPFVTYGSPSLKNIRALVYKRGYARIGRMGHRSRIRINRNEIISENLGKYGIHGMEDVVHELYTCGPHFKEVSSFLWPFKLHTPRGGYKAKRHGFTEAKGGDWGNREHLINPFIARML